MFEYPFSFQLGNSLPSSFQEHYDGSKEEAFGKGDTRGGWCSVEYFVEARVNGNSSLLSRTAFIVECDRAKERPVEPRWIQNSDHKEVKKCCMTRRNEIT